VAKAVDVAAQGDVGQLARADGVAGGQVLGGGEPDRRQEGAGDELVHLGADRLEGLAHAVEVALHVGDGLHQVGDAAEALGEQAVEVLVGEYRVISSCMPSGRACSRAARWLRSRSESAGSDQALRRLMRYSCHMAATMGARARASGVSLPAAWGPGVVEAPAFLVQVVDQAGDLGAVAGGSATACAVEEQGQPAAVGDDARQVLGGRRRGAELLLGGGQVVGDDDARQGDRSSPCRGPGCVRAGPR
jgi:hypothetical protein